MLLSHFEKFNFFAQSFDHHHALVWPTIKQRTKEVDSVFNLLIKQESAYSLKDPKQLTKVVQGDKL